MSTVVRAAEPGDVPELVELRLVNAVQHATLDPEIYRIPDSGAVRRHFTEAVTRDLILVADAGRHLAAMAEVLPVRDPPDHQILKPRPAAEVHTVVRPGERGQGLGRRMVEAAAQAAAERGITILYAGIFARNEPAVRFYTAAGFRPRGVTLARELGG
jgi:GNAT superfamily N-acetyltransferase